MRYIDRDEVARRLTYPACIRIVRDAMVALSQGDTLQLLRSILPLADGRLFGVMPGALGSRAAWALPGGVGDLGLRHAPSRGRFQAGGGRASIPLRCVVLPSY